MDKYIVTYSNADGIEKTETFTSEKPEEIIQALTEEGYTLRSMPRKISSEWSKFSQIMDEFRSKFATTTFSEEREVTVLRWWANAKRSWYINDTDAFRAIRYNVWKSNKPVRMISDSLVEASTWSWIASVADIFEKCSEYFSPMFLSLINESMRNTEANPVSIVSNPNPNQDKEEIPGYVELQTSILAMKKSMIAEMKWPIVKLVVNLVAVFSVLMLVVPNVLKAFGKFRDISQDNYLFVGDVTIIVSNFLQNWWIYFFWLIIMGISAWVFLIRTNENIRYEAQKILLRMPVIGDILTAYMTKFVVSFWAIFRNSGMQHKKTLMLISNIVTFLPIKYELEVIAERANEEWFEERFSAYPDEEKFFSEMFYPAISLASKNGRYQRSFSMILQNISDQWENDLKFYPQKIGNVILYVWLSVTSFFVVGLLLIFVITSVRSI